MNRGTIIDGEMVSGDIKMAEKKVKPMTSFTYYNDVINRSTNKIQKQQGSDLIESFLIDTQPKNLPL